jgi:hypothetical protein
MKYLTLITLGLALSGIGFTTGCEIHHTETDKPNLFGGSTHESDTTVKNPDGTTSTFKSEQKTD